MQDKYVGDVGDYGKFGLLRYLSTKLKDSLSIGVNWYFVKEAGAENSSDGKFVEYLGERPQKTAGNFDECDYERRSDKPKIRDLQECDFGLIKELRKIVWNNRRNLSEFMEKNVFYPEEIVIPKNNGILLDQLVQPETPRNNIKTLRQTSPDSLNIISSSLLQIGSGAGKPSRNASAFATAVRFISVSA